MNRASLAVATVAAVALLAVALRHPLAAVGAAPGLAMVAALGVLLCPGHGWRGAAPTLTWVVAGPTAAAQMALVGPCIAGIAVALPTLVALLPVAALPAALVYLAVGVALATGLSLRATTAATAAGRVAAALALLYGAPLYLLLVAELFPHPEQAIATALPLWPPAVAAALTGVDLARQGWAYAHLPLAYYPYHYPAALLAALPIAAAALSLHLTLWRRPHYGWRLSTWSP